MTKDDKAELAAFSKLVADTEPKEEKVEVVQTEGEKA